MTATIIHVDSLAQLPKDTTFEVVYEPPLDGVVYTYQRPQLNGRKWRVMYFVIRNEVER